MQILFADSRNEKCQTNRDGNKHRRGNIRIAKPTKFVQSFEDASATNTLYIMDEPTTGLHFDDINKLLAVLHKHVNAGNTLVVVEHNLDVIKSADWIIDLGPEDGAQVVRSWQKSAQSRWPRSQHLTPNGTYQQFTSEGFGAIEVL